MRLLLNGRKARVQGTKINGEEQAFFAHEREGDLFVTFSLIDLF
jgi:hypothetical protein